MDTEQQIRLNFLEEIEDYFDQIEAVVLSFQTTELGTASLDKAMRAAHSVKGGAAMMGFPDLSQVAHRLEDFFKILRVRPDAVDITAELESLFLRGVDALRLISHSSRQHGTVDTAVMQTTIHPVFEQLHHLLGSLRPEDDDLLLAQEEDVDVSAIIFASGVEDRLTNFETCLQQLPVPQLPGLIQATAEQMGEFGRMAGLETFVQLCESIHTATTTIQPEALATFAQEVLAIWQRSHALVSLGQSEHLPNAIALAPQWLALPSQEGGTPSVLDPMAPAPVSPTDLDGALDLAELNLTREADEADGAAAALDWLLAENTANLWDIPDLFDDVDVMLAAEDDLTLGLEHPSATQVGLDLTPPPTAVAHPSPPAPTLPDLLSPPTGAQEAYPFQSEVPVETLINAPPSAVVNLQDSPNVLEGQLEGQLEGNTVRVSAQQLQQLSTLFGKLIVERNAINLRFSQLHSLVNLMQERMGQLERANYQLRSWYDQASTAGLVAPSSAPPSALGQENLSPASYQPNGITKIQHQFDVLELDRYTDLHVISQEQMERIVQLQEVTSDIALSLREASSATADLNYTSQALQGGMTKIQMRPFSTLVKRFPRVVRDLALQYDKPVNLKIEGELTLIDRVAVEALSAPLNHLLRNAFDHGIEPTDERIANGKPVTGRITIRAMHRGNRALVTIEDDGRGIDLDRIRHRLQSLGMTSVELAQLPEHEVLAMIFEPGFSTAEQVTELSGRGVGMDVVRTNLQQIRGDIRVDTRPGEGTTFTIQVPLAVSVLRVMLVESARLVFAVPINSIQAMTSLPSGHGDGDPALAWEGQPVELIHLDRWLNFQTTARPFEMDGNPTIAQPTVLIINQGDGLYGICIDRFWGEQEISLSPLRSPVAVPSYFSSMSILGDGRVVPLVDPYQLLEWVQSQFDGQARPMMPLSAGATRTTPSATVAQRLVERKSVAEPVDETPTLLVVDDSVNVRRYLALTLERVGYQVEQAKDGQEAVDKLVAGLAVKAVICDIEMPRMDGYGVLSELRSRAEFKSLPIAMLTSRMNEKHRKLAMNLGASAYFSKPYNDQELLRTLQKLIEQAECTQAA